MQRIKKGDYISFLNYSTLLKPHVYYNLIEYMLKPVINTFHISLTMLKSYYKIQRIHFFQAIHNQTSITF